jgi:hypothetical protein
VMLVATAHGNALENLIRNPTLSDLVGGIQSVTLGDEEARRRRTQKTVLERAAEPTFPMAVEMHSRHRWLVHRDVAGTVDLLLRGHSARPEIRELGADGQVLRRQEAAPLRPPSPAAERSVTPIAGSGLRPVKPLAPVPMPDPLASPQGADTDLGPGGTVSMAQEAVASPTGSTEPLRLYGVGLPAQLLETAARGRGLPVEVVADPERAEALLSLRGELGRDPALRRRAQLLGLPILVIKSDSLHQLQRAMERLLDRRGGVDAADGPERSREDPDPLRRLDDAHAALEECRRAVEQVVLPLGQPVELLPRNERVRQMQAELISRYRLRSAVFGRGPQQRLRVFPA